MLHADRCRTFKLLRADEGGDSFDWHRLLLRVMGDESARATQSAAPADSADAARRYTVLFLCTGNSARSILAEALLRRVGGGRFDAFSAGSHPVGRINPFALELLERDNVPTEGLRSKNWEEFARPESPRLDFVFTVCDNAAGELCPVWPGQPITAHWGIPDPAAIEGSDEIRRKAFAETRQALLARIRIFTSLPLAALDRLSAGRKLDEIGKLPADTTRA